MNILEYKKSFDKFYNGYKKSIVKSVDNNTNVVENIIREQMLSGIREDDSEIVPSYRNDTYAKYKYNLHPLNGGMLNITPRWMFTPNLIDTGDFHRGIKATVKNERISIESIDSKSESLEKKYTSKIFGLSSYGRIYLINNIIFPELIKFKNNCGL